MSNATPFGASSFGSQPPFGSEPSFGSQARFGAASDGSFAASALPCVGGNCGDAVHDLYPFLDGELDLNHRSAVQAHLDSCPSCVAAFRFEGMLRSTVRTRLSVPVPPDLATKIRLALAADNPPEPLR
jgi:anti-sigma factor (TIGR02949 family)